MKSFLGLSFDVWTGAVFGAILSSIVIPIVWFGLRVCYNRYRNSRPRIRLLGGLAQDSQACTIFIRDFLLPNNSQILAAEPCVGIGQVPNVRDLWADVDARALSHVFNVLGQAGKQNDIHIVRMSKDTGIWNTHIVVIGGQSQKSFDFYARLQHVFYKMDSQNIIESQTGQPILKDPNYGYGIILKVRNPYKNEGEGIGLLVGGFGTLGTAAAGYYLREHAEELGRQFGTKCFGVVIRASITAGEEAAERLREYDRKCDSH